MPNSLNVVRIQQQIIDLLQVGPYYRAFYDCNTNKLLDIDEALPPSTDPTTPASPNPTVVSPSAVFCMWQSEAFGQDQLKTRRARNATSWIWECRVDFQCPALVYRVVDNLTAFPPVLLHENGQRLAKLNLQSISPSHPITQESHSGSRYIFVFNVLLFRR